MRHRSEARSEFRAEAAAISRTRGQVPLSTFRTILISASQRSRAFRLKVSWTCSKSTAFLLSIKARANYSAKIRHRTLSQCSKTNAIKSEHVLNFPVRSKSSFTRRDPRRAFISPRTRENSAPPRCASQRVGYRSRKSAPRDSVMKSRDSSG